MRRARRARRGARRVSVASCLVGRVLAREGEASGLFGWGVISVGRRVWLLDFELGVGEGGNVGGEVV